jgi:hypothetical protein
LQSVQEARERRWEVSLNSKIFMPAREIEETLFSGYNSDIGVVEISHHLERNSHATGIACAQAAVC